jgi:hypothetical protein
MKNTGLNLDRVQLKSPKQDDNSTKIKNLMNPILRKIVLHIL